MFLGGLSFSDAQLALQPPLLLLIMVQTSCFRALVCSLVTSGLTTFFPMVSLSQYDQLRSSMSSTFLVLLSLSFALFTCC